MFLFFKLFLLMLKTHSECLQGKTVRKPCVFGKVTAVETPKAASALTCSLGFLIINHDASGQIAERW